MSTPGAVRAAQSILNAESWDSHELFMQRVEALAAHIDKCIVEAEPGAPAKHPDTELIDAFEALNGSLEYCDADDELSHWRASGYAGSHERAGSSLRDALRAAIDAARKA